MQTSSESAGGKSEQSGGVDPRKEAAYWREQHPKQPYAKDYSYDQFEHAYKTGYNSFFKYPGEIFDVLEANIGLGYGEAKPGSPLPGERVVPEVTAVWASLGGVISRRDPSRGVRGGM